MFALRCSADLIGKFSNAFPGPHRKLQISKSFPGISRVLRVSVYAYCWRDSVNEFVQETETPDLNHNNLDERNTKEQQQ